MKIRYKGPHDAVEVDGVGTVRHNHQVDVSDEVAGHPPDERVEPAMRELHQAITDRDHHLAVKLREEIGSLDFGSGLLAQADNWAPVASKDAKKDEGSS